MCAKISNVLVGHLLYSQTPPVENGPFPLDFFRLDSSGPSTDSSRVDFIVFMLLLEAVGVREYYCSTSECQSKIGYQVCQLCFGHSSWATRVSRATSLCPSGSVALSLAESRQSYARGVALSREPKAMPVALHLAESRQRYSRRPLFAKRHR